MATIFGVSYPRNQISEVSGVDVNELLYHPTGIAFDGNGNMFLGNYDDDRLCILCPRATTIYGIECSANVITSINSLDTQSFLTYPASLAIDEAGNLIILDNTNGIGILPKNTITFFGVNCPANQITPIGTAYGGTVNFGQIEFMKGLAMDAAGNLFLGVEDANAFFVLSPVQTTLYGISIPANTLTSLSSLDPNNLLIDPTGLAFDKVGNLYIGSVFNDILCVLCPADTTVFGIDVSRNRITDIGLRNASLAYPSALAVDKDGNLFIGTDDGRAIYILPTKDVTLYGTPYPANVISSLSDLDVNERIDEPYGIAFDTAGNLFIGSSTNNYLCVLPGVEQILRFSTSIFGTTYATETTYLFFPKTITDFLAKPNGSRDYTQGTKLPVGTPLTDTGRRKYAYGRNKLITYVFHEVQRMDTLESGYLCTWAASGEFPATL